MLLSIASVIKPPAPGFERTHASVFREFGRAQDVEFLIKEYSPSQIKSRSKSDPRQSKSLAHFHSDNDFDIDGKLEVRVLRSPDSGVFDGMNQAIDAARGEWMLFLNAGDWLARGIGDALRAALGNHEKTDFLYFDGVTVDADDGREFLRKAPDVLTLRDFFNRAPVLHPCLCVRRSLLEAFKFNTTFDLAADFDLMVRLVEANKKGVHIAHVGAFVLSGGLSEKFRIQARRQAKQSLLCHGHGWRNDVAVRYAFFRFLVRHFLIVGLIQRIPALQKRAHARSGGMPAGTY